MTFPHRAYSYRETAALSTPLRIALVVTCLLVFSTLNNLQLKGQDKPTEVTADDVNDVARHLWCPLCGGRLRLDSCELKACSQMREVIALKLTEGEDAESIRSYFLDQYGPQVLGEPPRQGFNWLAWILPVIAVAGGAVFLWLRLREMSRPLTEATVTVSDTDLDERERRLEEELARYD